MLVGDIYGKGRDYSKCVPTNSPTFPPLFLLVHRTGMSRVACVLLQ